MRFGQKAQYYLLVYLIAGDPVRSRRIKHDVHPRMCAALSALHQRGTAKNVRASGVIKACRPSPAELTSLS